MLRKAHSTSSGMARISHVSLEAKFVSAQHVYFNLLKLFSLYLPPLALGDEQLGEAQAAALCIQHLHVGALC